MTALWTEAVILILKLSEVSNSIKASYQTHNTTEFDDKISRTVRYA